MKAVCVAFVIFYTSCCNAAGYAIKDATGKNLGFLVASAHQPIVLNRTVVQLLEQVASSTTLAYFELLRQDHPPVAQQRASFGVTSLRQAMQVSDSKFRYPCVASLSDQQQFVQEAKQPKSMPAFLSDLNAAIDWPVQAAFGIAFTGTRLINDRTRNEVPLDARFSSPDQLLLSIFQRGSVRVASLETWYEQTASDRKLSEVDALMRIEASCESYKTQGDAMAVSVTQLESLYKRADFDQIRMLFERGFQTMRQHREWESKFLHREKLMAERIDHILKTATKPSTISFVLGMAHIGRDGVVSRLKNLGYSLEPIVGSKQEKK